MQKVNWTLETSGDGYWSSIVKKVNVVAIEIYANEDKTFGELCVYFDDTWNIQQDGLIYTDSLFMEQLQDKLSELGLAGDDVSYSEQGMQGDDYVSCDVGEQFLSSWEQVFTES